MSQQRSIVLVIGLGLVALSATVVAMGDLTRQISRLLIVFGLMYALYITAVSLLYRIAAPDRRTLVLVFAVAAMARVVLIPSTPALSDDIYRYAWEGRVISAGYNPFSHPPNAAELAPLRNAEYERINHKHMETIYPPFAQGVFTIGAFVGQGVMWQKILFVLFDLATLVVLMLFIRARGGNPALSAVYGWSPLVLLEFSHSGHMDSLGIFCLVVALFFFDRGRYFLGSLSMALSFLAKFVAIVLVPFVAMRRLYWRGLLLFCVVAIVGYAPFAGASDKLFASLGAYSRHWDFNSFGFTILRHAIENTTVVRIMLLVVAVVFAVYQGYRQRDVMRYTYLVVGCALLVSPTLYPWYLCWIIPFLCFYRSRAWLYLTGAVVLSYQVWPVFHDTGVWQVGWGILLIEYLPFLSLLAYDGYRGRQARRVIAS